MPNRYRSGRAFEYKRIKIYRGLGYKIVSRTAGSHGAFDIYVLSDDLTPTAIQCKVARTLTEGHRLLDNFVKHPPLKPSGKYRQQMDVYIREAKAVVSEVV